MPTGLAETEAQLARCRAVARRERQQLPIDLGRVRRAAQLVGEERAPPPRELGRGLRVEGLAHQLGEEGVERGELLRALRERRHLVEDLDAPRGRGGGLLQRLEGAALVLQLTVEQARRARQQLRGVRRVGRALREAEVDPHERASGPVVADAGLARGSLRSVERAHGGLDDVDERGRARRERHGLRDVEHRALTILHRAVGDLGRAQQRLDASGVVRRGGLAALVDDQQLLGALRSRRERLGEGEHVVVLGRERAGAQRAVERPARVAGLFVEQARVADEQRDLDGRRLCAPQERVVDLPEPRPRPRERRQAVGLVEPRRVREIERERSQDRLERALRVAEVRLVHATCVGPALGLRGRRGLDRLRELHVQLRERLAACARLAVRLVSERAQRVLCEAIAGILHALREPRPSAPGVVEPSPREVRCAQHERADDVLVLLETGERVERVDELAPALERLEQRDQALLRRCVGDVRVRPGVERPHRARHIVQALLVELREALRDRHAEPGVFGRGEVPLERLREERVVRELLAERDEAEDRWQMHAVEVVEQIAQHRHRVLGAQELRRQHVRALDEEIAGVFRRGDLGEAREQRLELVRRRAASGAVDEGAQRLLVLSHAEDLLPRLGGGVLVAHARLEDARDASIELGADRRVRLQLSAPAQQLHEVAVASGAIVDVAERVERSRVARGEVERLRVVLSGAIEVADPLVGEGAHAGEDLRALFGLPDLGAVGERLQQAIPALCRRVDALHAGEHVEVARLLIEEARGHLERALDVPKLLVEHRREDAQQADALGACRAVDALPQQRHRLAEAAELEQHIAELVARGLVVRQQLAQLLKGVRRGGEVLPSLTVQAREPAEDLRLGVRVERRDRVALEHLHELVPALELLEELAERRARVGVRRVERGDGAPGVGRAVEVAHLVGAERGDLTQPLLARVDGQPRHPRGGQQQVAQLLPGAAPAQLILEERERVRARGVHLQQLVGALGGARAIALRDEHVHHLAQARRALLRSEAGDRDAERARDVRPATDLPVQLDQPLGGGRVADVEERLEAHDGVLGLPCVDVGLAESAPHLHRAGGVRRRPQEGDPAHGQQVRARDLERRLLEQRDRPVVIGGRVERGLCVRDRVLRRDALGHLVEQIGRLASVPVARRRRAVLLRAAQEHRGEIVHHAEVARRVAERVPERADRALEIRQALGPQVRELAQQRDAPREVRLGRGLELVELRGRLQVPRGAVDLSRRVDRGHELRVELERSPVVEHGAIGPLKALLVELPELQLDGRARPRIAARLERRLGASLEQFREASRVARLLGERLEALERLGRRRAALERPLVERDAARAIPERAEREVGGFEERLRARSRVRRARCPALEQVDERGPVALLVVVRTECDESRVIVGVSPQSGDELVRCRVHMQGRP